MENIQVALRMRPLSRIETQRCEDSIWVTHAENKTVALSNQCYKDPLFLKKLSAGIKPHYTFDCVFNQDQDNASVYQRVIRRVALSSLNGINGTIFMYGQTGSGKTYTMMGYNKGDDETENATSCSDSPVGKISPKKSFERLCSDITDQQTARESNPETFTTFMNAPVRSFSVEDISRNTGILILALQDIFKAIDNDLDKTYFLKCSYVEIYNDQIYDLLKPADKLQETLAVNEDSKKEFFIKGVTEEYVSSIEEILQKLERGETNRHYARTMMNHTSSRSHTIFRLMVQTLSNNFIREYRVEKSQGQSNINNPDLKSQVDEALTVPSGSIVTESLLNFVDLAGSEKVSNHHTLLEETASGSLEYGGIYGKDSMLAASKVKERVKEGQHINKSLFFLTQVISLKSEGKSNLHIPYRNSPLTKILRSSLGGNSRTLVILCATPAASQFEQTLSTFRFGMNAKKIENKVHANIVTNDDTEVFRILISDYERKLKEMETARHEDYIRNCGLLKQIEELQSQKAALIERMNLVLKFQLARMGETIPKDELASFFKQVRERTIHFDQVGILFTAKSLNKYDAPKSRRSKSSRGGKSNRRTQGSLDRSQYDSCSDTEYEETVGALESSRGGITQRAKEMASNLSAIGLKTARQQIALLQKKVLALQENFAELSKRHLENYENYLDVAEECDTTKKKFSEETKVTKLAKQRLREKCTLAKRKIEELVVRCKKELCTAAELKSQLRLYRDMQGLEDLNDEELGKMESHLWTKIDEVKTEKARRVVQKETGIMYTKKPLHRSLSAKEEEELMVSLNDLDTCETSYNELEIEPVDSQKKEKMGKEIEEFAGIFKKGIFEIDAELEQLKKVSVEAEISLIETKKEKERELKEIREARQRNSRRETMKEDERKNNGATSNRSKERDIQRQSTLKTEPRLDLMETLAELKVEMELMRIKSQNEAELQKLRNMNDMKKGYSRNKQEKKDGKNTNGSLIIDGKVEDMEIPDKGSKELDSKEDIELNAKCETMRVLKFEHDLNTSQEELLKNSKTLRNSKSISVVTVKEILNTKPSKANSRPSIERSATIKKAAEPGKEKLKKSATQTFGKNEGNTTSRPQSTERPTTQRKDTLNISRRASITEQLEEVPQSQRVIKTEDERDILVKVKKEPKSIANGKKQEKTSKAKSVEKTHKKKKDEEEPNSPLKKTGKTSKTPKSKERIPGSPDSKIHKLKLFLNAAESVGEKNELIGAVAMKKVGELSQRDMTQDQISSRQIEIQERIQENRYYTPQKVSGHRRNSSSLQNIKEEESKGITFEGPFTDMASIDVGDMGENHYLSYIARNNDITKTDNGQSQRSHRRDATVSMSAVLIESRNSSITRIDGDLNTSDITYSVGDDSKKRRSREERKKERTLGSKSEAITATTSPVRNE